MAPASSVMEIDQRTQYNSDMAKHITKSRVLSGLRCPKRLWLQTFRPELATNTPTSDLTIANGNEVGKVARLNYPNGILIEFIEQPDLAVVETKRWLNSSPSVPLFEAAFVHAGVLVRADILMPVENSWRVIEVKSSGSVKDHHLIDCAVQLWVMEGARIDVKQVCLAHVDTDFVYAGDGNFDRLLVEEDITDRVRELLPNVPEWLALHRVILDNPVPAVRMGSQCKPDCQFTDHCEKDETEYPVSILPNGRRLITDLQDAGYDDIRAIPEGVLTNNRHIMVWQATRTNQAFISPTLKTEFANLPYPRFYLDFETINFVIPRWAGTRPHQQLPFQWSCHVERQRGELEHREFLYTSGNAPMLAFAESLIVAVETDGPIIVYGTFESTVIKGLIEFYPDLGNPLNDILDRLVNLLPWLQNHYYHPAMKGSWSIKTVLPTIAPDLDYSQLDDVQNGTLAQLAYLDIIDPDTPPVVRDQKIHNLLRYCELDTQAMFEVVAYFEGDSD
ncbi:hypothetical protein GALL_119080 [mine drainage metagenome]|uniref:DUF2779 domain-containing protein n=1 Tax=mine drainage metagenome TaxID=410659 RepID=A0A1J5SCN0_9ZZZZ